MHKFDLLHNAEGNLHHFIKIHTNNFCNARNIMENMYLHTLNIISCLNQVNFIIFNLKYANSTISP